MIRVEGKWIEYNVSIVDKIFAFANFIKGKYATIRLYRKAYKNYLGILLGIVRKRYPIGTILRKSNISLVLESETEIAFIAYTQVNEDIKYDTTSKQISLSFFESGEKKKVRILRFLDGKKSGDIIAIFFQNIYGYLVVPGASVIDIGAQIADSSIYFAAKGAKRVIAVEPLLTNYQIARRNIALNGMSHQISLILAACGSRSTNDSSNEEYFESGARTKAPALTLEEILGLNQMDKDEKLVLKIDCEGCEYRIIFDAKDETLRRFSHVQIEYHSGYRNLKKKFEDLGFKVSVSRPTAVRLSNQGEKSMMRGYKYGEWQMTGYLYATYNSQ
jgi:FkbM family methyltransferase